MTPRAVLVVHRRPMVAEGVAAALAGFPGVAVLGVATTAGGAEERAVGADAVALDRALAGATGLARRLRRRGVRVVWIEEGDAPPAEPATGGDGDGEVRVSADAPVAALAEALVPGADGRRPVELSVRQARVLALVAEGLTARQVARHLGISEKTVEKHKHRIFEKLGVPNQAAAVHAALTRGPRGRP